MGGVRNHLDASRNKPTSGVEGTRASEVDDHEVCTAGDTDQRRGAGGEPDARDHRRHPGTIHQVADESDDVHRAVPS